MDFVRTSVVFVLAACFIGLTSAACDDKTSISCSAGQTAIDENDLEFELRRENGIDEYISPTAETSVVSKDKIWVKYRPAGVTAVLQDVKCFEADFYDTTKASFVFELSGAKTKQNFYMAGWNTWVNDVGVDDNDNVDGYDTIRIRANNGGDNRKVKNFDFVGCA